MTGCCPPSRCLRCGMGGFSFLDGRRYCLARVWPLQYSDAITGSPIRKARRLCSAPREPHKPLPQSAYLATTAKAKGARGTGSNQHQVRCPTGTTPPTLASIGITKKQSARAAWLGNDEVHYVRKWQDKDIEDLKRLIRLTEAWVLHSLLTDDYLADMPEGGPSAPKTA